jgi:NAD(P)-dependent dehydrogenase (short-subunit alcohol dehydrogenase family)
MDLARWRGRVALVTGASSGIGRAVAERLAEAHMRVVVCGRRRARLHELAERLGAHGAEVLPIAVDLRREGDAAALFARVRSGWGGVDVLVNSAGLGRDAPLLDGPTDAWREMFELNVLALCVCTREAVHDMRRRGDSGHVVHVSSMSAYRVPPQAGAYAATKHAVRALTEGLRAELRALNSGIRVSSVSPGTVACAGRCSVGPARPSSPRSITRARSGRGRLTRAIRSWSRATSRRRWRSSWPSRVTSRFTTSSCARPSSLPEETRS